MSISSMVSLLQTKHAAVSGVHKAPTSLKDIPRGEINPADMPYVITIPAEGSWRQESLNALNRQDRNFRVIVIVAPVGQGYGTEWIESISTLIQAFGNMYLTRSTQALQGSNPQITIKASIDAPIIDSGYDSELIFNDTAYRGFEFTVGVYEKG